MATISLSSHPLEGDGVVENLYHYLHTKTELDGGPAVLIPDTVVYKFRQPAYWYFTSKSGQIKKKSRYNLSNIRIEEVFTRTSYGSDIVAYYLSTNADTGITTIEYFNSATLSDFLYNREKVNNGILQKFIEPKGTRNSMIRGIWSPKIVMLERRENINHLVDTKMSLYERAVTYEGAEHYSRPSQIRGSILPLAVQNACKEVVNHISEVSFRKYNVSRMALNLKVDGEDRLWLLWCSSLRLEHSAGTRSPIGSPGSSVTAPRSPSRGQLNLVPVRQKAPSKLGPVSMLAHCQVPESVARAFNTTKASRSIAKHMSGGMERPEVISENNAAEPKSPGRALQSAGASSNIVPVDMGLCKSCNCKVLADRFYKVSYQILVAHFEQFMALLAASNGGSMRVEWPPNPKVIEAVGKVGLGPLEKLREAVRAAKDKSKVAVLREDIEIPPVLRDLHPNLSADDYSRFRRDPMFLYKTTVVCEDCYLVLAQISPQGGTGSHADSNPLLGSDHAIVDPEAVKRRREAKRRAAQEHVERASRARNESKAQRRREKALKKKASLLKKGLDGVSSSNRLGKLQGPGLPPRIDEHNIGSLSISRSQPVLKTQLEFQKNLEASQHSPTSAEGSRVPREDDDFLPDEFKQELAERENAFFRDLYRNPNLHHGHPLSHMIATQAKLATSQASLSSNKQTMSAPQIHIAELAPTLDTETPARRDKSPSSPMSKARTEAHGLSAASQKLLASFDPIDRKSPYAKTQVVEVASKSVKPERRPRSRSRLAEMTLKPVGQDNQNEEDVLDLIISEGNPAKKSGKNAKTAESNARSSAEHREFLLSTLQRVQQQLDNPMPLGQAIGLGTTADAMGTLVDRHEPYDVAWEMRQQALDASQSEEAGQILRETLNFSGVPLTVSIDLQGENFTITIFNPHTATSQRIPVPADVVLRNAPTGCTKAEDLASFILESLQEDAGGLALPFLQ